MNLNGIAINDRRPTSHMIGAIGRRRQTSGAYDDDGCKPHPAVLGACGRFAYPYGCGEDCRDLGQAMDAKSRQIKRGGAADLRGRK